MSSACSLPLARNATVGPLPETIAAERAVLLADVEGLPQRGPQAGRRRLQVVAQRRRRARAGHRPAAPPSARR